MDLEGGGHDDRATAHVPRLPLVAMALVALVDAVDTAVARGVLPLLEDEWNLSDVQLGLIPTVFVALSVVATVPAGYLSDRVRRTRLMGWTLVSWSALTLLSATAVNFVNLLGARAVMGIGQAVDDPASTSYLADSYPARSRGRVYSVQQVALFLGGGLGLAAGGLVGERWGWRWAFALVGLPGLLLAPVVFRLREPSRGESDRRQPDRSEPALGVMTPGAPADRPSPHPASAGPPGADGFATFLRLNAATLLTELRGIFRIATMRYLLVGLAAIYFTLSAVSTWLPLYHERYSGMSTTEATGATGAILIVGGFVGTLLGGWCSDRFQARWRGGRIVIVVWSCLAFSALVLASFVVRSVPLGLMLQLLGMVLVAGAGPGLRAAMVEVVPAEQRGIGASALGLTTALFGTAAAPLVVGAISDATGSLVVAFYIAFVPAMLGLLELSRARHSLDDDVRAVHASAIPAEVMRPDEAPGHGPPAPV